MKTTDFLVALVLIWRGCSEPRKITPFAACEGPLLQPNLDPLEAA